MTNFRNTKFIKSAPSVSDKPEKNLPEVLFVGKSNVGKSTLINLLTQNKNLAHTSSKPGFTKLLNYYEVDGSFYLVDAPGYGYTISGSRHLESFGKMMEDYFANPHLKLIIFLIDSRHEMSKDDKDFYDFLAENDLPYLLVATKVDKLNQSENAKLDKYLKSINVTNYLKISSLNNSLIEKLRNEIISSIK